MPFVATWVYFWCPGCAIECSGGCFEAVGMISNNFYNSGETLQVLSGDWCLLVGSGPISVINGGCCLLVGSSLPTFPTVCSRCSESA